MTIHMHQLLFVTATLAVVRGYNLDSDFSGPNFFDNLNFFSGNDPTDGYVNFLTSAEAWSTGLIYAATDKIIIGSDNKNIATGRGRDSIRIQSNKAWNSGLFILDAINMPTGCGTWPAWWMVGPNWPNSGEIDIIEGVNTDTQDQTTLHTSDGCVINDDGHPFTGTWAKNNNGGDETNCYVNAPDQCGNCGCGIIGGGGSFGVPFNDGQGGVYAMEWTGDFIRTFYFPRNSIPGDITNGNPDPRNWGEPYAYFNLDGGACNSNHFNNMNMVFDLTFCGQWAGATFQDQCPGKGSCQTFVQQNPTAFNQAYWWVKSVKVYV